MSNVLIKGDVISRIINEKMVGREKLLSLASDMGTLNNGVQAGDTVSVIKFAHLSEATDITKGTPIALEDVEATKSSETIEHKGKGFVIYDIEANTTIGGKDIVTKKAEDVADVFVRAMEKSLGGKLVNAPLKFATASADAITATEINSALANAFGDDQDVDTIAGIVVNSKVATGFYAMPEFVSADLTHTQGGNGVVRNGLIGYFRGMPVFMSDVCTYDSTKAECVSFIIKKESIGYKRVFGEVEPTRNASLKRTEVYGDIAYFTAILDDTGVVVMRKTIA